jgi:[calcium/calmodulin-dependent protein kinase] kinase
MAGKAVDIWALGVTLYCFVHGHCPFQSDNILELADMIENQPAEISEALSPDLKDLLEKMLQKNPTERIKLADIKRHAWVTSNGHDEMMATEDNCCGWEDVTEEEINGALRYVLVRNTNPTKDQQPCLVVFWTD